MPLDFDPIYYTETMVRILREQGSPQLAMELAAVILQRQPDHAAVAQILQELKTEARLAFERFKNSGRTEPSRPEPQDVSAPESEAEDIPASPAPEEGLTALEPVETPAEPSSAKIPELLLVQGGSLVSGVAKKVQRLQDLLGRIQERRGSHEAVPS